MKARALFSIFRTECAKGFQYRADGLAGAAVSIFYVFLELIVFSLFYRFGDNPSAGADAGMAFSQLATYVWLGQIFFLMQPSSVDPDIHEQIVNGNVGIDLCRPLDLYAFWFSRSAARRLTPLFWRGSLILLVSFLAPAGFRAGAPASAEALFLSLATLCFAFFLCASYGMLVNVVRLGVTWGEGPTYLMTLIGMVLSGAYFPLQLAPDFLRPFLFYQPFAGYFDLPMRLYTGILPPGEALVPVLVQVGWSGLFLLAGRLLLKKKLRSVVVQGG